MVLSGVALVTLPDGLICSSTIACPPPIASVMAGSDGLAPAVYRAAKYPGCAASATPIRHAAMSVGLIMDLLERRTGRSAFTSIYASRAKLGSGLEI